MKINYGGGTTKDGPGVSIRLTGDQVATAIEAYLMAHDVVVVGPRTILVNDDLCEHGHVYIDPSGFAVVDGSGVSGRGPDEVTHQKPLV